jgi:putative protein-disulfide isomerase
MVIRNDRNGMKLLYVFDAYCGWSYGFAGTLTEVVARHPELTVDVISGGLFTGTRRVPIRQFGYVEDANAEISELTGAQFGAGYQRLIANGSFVMDSEAAATGMAALRQAAPQSAVALAVALQRAFYLDGCSLSEPDTYRRVARASGLVADRVVAAFCSPETRYAAQEDFHRARRLGVEAYPTLLAVRGDSVVAIATGHATVDLVERRLAAASATLSA